MDEQDKVLVKAQGHFLNSFKVGAGLVVNIQKGTNFSMEQRKINDEVWLPARFEGQGSFRFLLFAGINGTVKVANFGLQEVQGYFDDSAWDEHGRSPDPEPK